MPYTRTMIYPNSGDAHTETMHCKHSGCTPAVPTEDKEGGILHGLTTGEVLKALDDWAWTAPPEAIQDLWDVLSALRGPDDHDYKLKAETTGIIRKHALPLMTSHMGVVTTDGPLPSIKKYQGTDQYQGTDLPGLPHFRAHVIQAIQALQRIEKERN